MRVERSRFESNSADSSGGALYVSGGVVSLLDGTLLAKNTADKGATIDLLASGRVTYDLVRNEMSSGETAAQIILRDSCEIQGAS